MGAIYHAGEKYGGLPEVENIIAKSQSLTTSSAGGVTLTAPATGYVLISGMGAVPGVARVTLAPMSDNYARVTDINGNIIASQSVDVVGYWAKPTYAT